MKRTIACIILVLGAVFIISAHEEDQKGNSKKPPGPGYRYHHGNRNNFHQQRGPSRDFPGPHGEKVNISGKLKVLMGSIAVTDGEITYLTVGLGRFAGFIEDFKEDSHVALEGYAFPYHGNAGIKILRTQKMTLNNKEYDVGYPLRGNTGHQKKPEPQMRQKHM